MTFFTCSSAFIITVALFTWQPAKAADPEVKRKLVPRAIPGMSHSPAGTSSPTTTKPRTISAGKLTSQEASQADSTAQAHILAVYRRGTFTLPIETQLENAAAISAQPSTPAAPALVAPPPGKVKVISKSEAEKFAKQPSP